MAERKALVPQEHIESHILLIRGHKVMLDSDLAALYRVEAKALNQAVKRNSARFPEDFMFQLTAEEAAGLRSQFVTLKSGRGQHRKYLPPMPSPSKALPCSPVCCAANGPSR